MPVSIGNGSWPNNSDRTTLEQIQRFGSNHRELARQRFFGTDTIDLGVTFRVSTTMVGTLTQTAWEKGPDGWTLLSGGTDRFALMFVPTDPTRWGFRLRLVDAADEVRIVFQAAEDARDSYEAAVRDVTGTLTAQVRLVTDAVVAAAAVTNGSGDEPPSAACESDVSSLLSTGEPYTMEVLFANGVAEFRLNGETTARLKHTPLEFIGHIAVGFSSAVNNARVVSAELFDLTGQTTSAERVLAWVCNDALWATFNGQPRRVASNLFGSTTGRVKMAELNGRLLVLGPLVNGIAKVYEFNPVAFNAPLFVPTQGALPGQTDAGTTTAGLVALSGTRTAFARPRGDEQNIILSAVANSTDMDTGSELPGHAYSLSGINRPLKIGEPITCLQQATKSVTIVGCENSIQSLLGDPALGQFDTDTLLKDTGVPGDQCMVQLEEGRVVAYSMNGVYAVPPIGVAVNLSEDVLVGPLTIEESERTSATIVLAQDPERGWLWFFKTPSDGSTGTHLVYIQQLGGFGKGAPAYFLVSFPDEMQPTCAVIWKGQMVVGRLDGRLATFEDDIYSDDGKAINARVVGQLLDSPAMGDDACLKNLRVELTPESSPVTVKVFGASKPAELYDSARRSLLLAETFYPFQVTPIDQEVRAPSLIVEISNNEPGQTFVIEGVEGDVGISEERTSV